jgi:hypothetical protein
MILEYEDRFMVILRYDPHLNMENLKVNKFVFNHNFNIDVKVRIIIPQKLQDAVKKALIAKEDLNNGGQGRNPSIPTRHTTSGVKKHQKSTC